MNSLCSTPTCVSNCESIKSIFDWVESSTVKLAPLFQVDNEQEQISQHVHSCLREMLLSSRLQKEVRQTIVHEFEDRQGKFGAPLSESCKVMLELAKQHKIERDTLDLSNTQLISADGKSSAASELQELALLLPSLKKLKLNKTALARGPSEIIKVLPFFQEVYELHVSSNQLIFSMETPPYININTIYLGDLMQMKSLRKIVIRDSYIAILDKKQALKKYPELEIIDDETHY
jgi:Leucine-rich repeat (LRR) protein